MAVVLVATSTTVNFLLSRHPRPLLLLDPPLLALRSLRSASLVCHLGELFSRPPLPASRSAFLSSRVHRFLVLGSAPRLLGEDLSGGLRVLLPLGLAITSLSDEEEDITSDLPSLSPAQGVSSP
jgi:hypothetical protein